MRSYLDILTELKETIESDEVMNKRLKKKVMNVLNELFYFLWPYSD